MADILRPVPDRENDPPTASGEVSLIRSRIQAGIWEGHIKAPAAAAAPSLEARWRGEMLARPVMTALPDRPGRWHAEFAIPAALLSDGTQTVVICRRETDEVIGHFSLIAGEALDQDLRAEMDLMRAEIDMLKKAFRRHIRESGES